MIPNDTASTGHTSYLARPDGRIRHRPLIVLVPGLGDLRAGYRFLAPALRAAGYRVACTDLRGHGDSDARFPSYGDEETAGDVVALITELGGPAVVVGNSMGAGPVVLAAAQRPELARLDLAPTMRNTAMNATDPIRRPWPGPVPVGEPVPASRGPVAHGRLRGTPHHPWPRPHRRITFVLATWNLQGGFWLAGVFCALVNIPYKGELPTYRLGRMWLTALDSLCARPAGLPGGDFMIAKTLTRRIQSVVATVPYAGGCCGEERASGVAA
jgi:pimeloyl-ACP methyl ester carboxylesterase